MQKLAPDAPNNVPRNSPFFLSSSDIISVVVLWPDVNIFLCIPVSATDAVIVNPNGIKTHLAIGLITFLLMVVLFSVMDQKVYQEILLIVSS